MDDGQPRQLRGDDASAAVRRGPLHALIVDQEWLWRKSGLVLGMMVALAVAVLTLSPMPSGRPMINGIDKLYHFVAFGLLIFPLILTDSRRWFWAVPLVVAFGGAIELIQPTVGRSAEWLDFGADLSGVLAGAALAELLHDRIRRSVFDGAAHDLAVSDAGDAQQRLELMRAELMDELREVLREELAALPRTDGADPAAPPEAASAATEGEVPRPQAARLRAISS